MPQQRLPLVDELAADIFMGSFSAKFGTAARISARVLRGTLYQRYYAIDADEIVRIPDPPKGRPSSELGAICMRRAGLSEVRSRPGVVTNGRITRRQFEPALRGLELAATGTISSDPAFADAGGRVFTGWTTLDSAAATPAETIVTAVACTNLISG